MFFELIKKLPESVKKDIIDIEPVILKTGKEAERITIDRTLSDKEKNVMKELNIIGIDLLASHKYAPEIKHSYFYMVY